MEATACWKQIPVDRRIFAATVMLAPLLMGGLCFSVGRTTENFTVGCYVGLFLSTALIIGALIGWIVHFGCQVVFGDDESSSGLNPLQYLARQVVGTVGGAIQKTAARIEAALMTVFSLIAIVVFFFHADIVGGIGAFFEAACIICLFLPSDSQD